MPRTRAQNAAPTPPRSGHTHALGISIALARLGGLTDCCPVKQKRLPDWYVFPTQTVMARFRRVMTMKFEFKTEKYSFVEWNGP